MPTARWGLAATTGLDGRIYAVGGFDGADNLHTVEVYDPSTGQWSAVAPLPSEASFLAAATGRDGRIYAFGGCVFVTECGSDYATYAYDPNTDSWTRLADMETDRAFLAGVTDSDGRIYAIGGYDDFSFPPVILSTVSVYDPSTDTWTAGVPMPTARMGLAAAVGPDGTIYALGGNDGTSQFLDTAEAFNPSTGAWSALPPMPTARRDLTAASSVVFGIGRIFAIGGHGLQFPLTTTEVYSP
jgi:N-acetylneuraminic acid mutarotase